MNLYLGCPIWAYKGWVGSLFPRGTKAGEFLHEYARRLTTVEGNTTFYAVPALEKIQQWVAETPETFRFCPKLPRAISHAGKLVENIAAAAQFVEIMGALGSRLGPMFLQLPPRYSPNLFADLQAFLEAWPPGTQLAVEVRHPGWFTPERHAQLTELLSGHQMARVIVDTRPIRSLKGDKILAGSVYQRMLQARERKPDLPLVLERTAPFIFLRYIGHPQLEYNRAFLDEWARQLGDWLRAGSEAYVFCHCPDERLDPWLCRDLHQRVSEIFPLPPLPWDEVDASATQQARLL
jgi:uncharacterized protein YecE (DUF72 family)